MNISYKKEYRIQITKNTMIRGQNEIEFIAKNLQQSDNLILIRFHALHNYIKSFEISNYVKSFFFNSTLWVDHAHSIFSTYTHLFNSLHPLIIA